MLLEINKEYIVIATLTGLSLQQRNSVLFSVRNKNLKEGIMMC